MSSPAEARRERRRVLVLFGLAVVPPVVILAVLSALAARNDDAASRFLAGQRARQQATEIERALARAIARVEEAVFGDLDFASFPGGTSEDLELKVLRARAAHPIVGRLFVLSEGGEILWPAPTLLELPREAAQESPWERPGATAEELGVIRGLDELYRRSLTSEGAGELPPAIAGYARIASDPGATPGQAARAHFRQALCLRQQGKTAEALAAFDRAADSPLPVRDERGVALRVKAALLAAQLAHAAGDPDLAIDRAQAIGRGLIQGRYAPDLPERDEWSWGIEEVVGLLETCGPAGVSYAAALRADEGALLARIAWRNELEQRLGPALRQDSEGLAAGEVRHHLRVGPPSSLVAFASLGERGSLMAGFELNLERLLSDVMEPTIERLQPTEALVAILDEREQVRTEVGGEWETGEARLVPLETIPLWRLRVALPAKQLSVARRNRHLLYGALVALTLITGLLGARSTIRYVRRSLELAEMKSDFLSNITHELKTPLTSIRMYGELLASGKVKTPEKQAEYYSHILGESTRLQKLIEDVLDFARLDSGKGEASYVLAEEDVADTVSEALDLFRASARVRGFDLFVDLPPVRALPPVDLDREAIVRALLNLLSNAVKYSGDQSFIRVTVARMNREWIAVGVQDRGIGIDAADLDRIFDRFYRAGDVHTRGVSGTGLGLSLVEQIVQAHAGQIHVESERGQGSTFTLRLPVVEDYRDQWPPPEDAAAGEAESQGPEA